MRKTAFLSLALAAAMLLAAPPALAADAPEAASTEVLLPAPQAAATGGGSLYDTIAVFRLAAGSYYDRQGFSTNRYAYTEAELMMLAKVIHLEVRGESYTAKLAVGNVVMNRVLSPGYPGNTIAEVVTRPNQFCYNPSVTPLPDCVRAAKDVLENEVWVVPQDVYFFRAVESRADWGKHQYLKHIGATAFYRDDYSGRSRNGLVPPSLGKRAYEWPQFGCEPGLRVAKVQQMLAGIGYAVEADGQFGEDTRGALIRFQKHEGLKPSGIADPATLNAMIRKYNSGNVILHQ
jgi:spore germination cell wall hydrolase CwlJ-like protein